MPTVAAILATPDEAAIIGLAISLLATHEGLTDEHAAALMPLCARFVQHAMSLGTDTLAIADELENADESLAPVADLIERTDFIPFGLPVAAVALEYGELANVLSLASFGLKYSQVMGGETPEWLFETFDGLANALLDIADEDDDVLTDIMDGVDDTMGALAVRLAGGSDYEAPGYI